MVTYVLTVGDDELAVGDDDDALSEVAEGGFSRALRKLSGGEQSNGKTAPGYRRSWDGDRGN